MKSTLLHALHIFTITATHLRDASPDSSTQFARSVSDAEVRSSGLDATIRATSASSRPAHKHV